MEQTVYHFVVNKGFLDGALDRFCQFFVCPLFTESCTEREMNAVDSEHKKNFQTDSRRSFQVTLTLTLTLTLSPEPKA